MRKNADVYRVVDCALLPAAPPGINPPPRTDGAPVLIPDSGQALSNNPVGGGIGGGIVFLLLLGACLGGAICLKVEQKYSVLPALKVKLGNKISGTLRPRQTPVVRAGAGTTQRMATPLTSDAAATGSYAAPLPPVPPVGGGAPPAAPARL